MFWIIYSFCLFIPQQIQMWWLSGFPALGADPMHYSLATQSGVPWISSTWELVRCAERLLPSWYILILHLYDTFWSCICIRSWGHSYAHKSLRCPPLEDPTPATFSFFPACGVRRSESQVAGLLRACTLPSSSRLYPRKPNPRNSLPKETQTWLRACVGLLPGSDPRGLTAQLICGFLDLRDGKEVFVSARWKPKFLHLVWCPQKGKKSF